MTQQEMNALAEKIKKEKLIKLVEEQRSQKVAEFGEIGYKEDCKHSIIHPNNARSCVILRNGYCKTEVCHFYDKKD